MRDSDAYQLNFDTGCQSGYPLLAFQKGGAAVEIDSIRLPDGVNDAISVRMGGDLRGLPENVHVSAGGLEVICAAEWTCADFDIQRAGTYTFAPRVSLSGCRIGSGSDVCEITVRVCAEEELPVITAWRLADGVPTAYTSDYGCAPEGFPTDAWAMIDGAEQSNGLHRRIWIIRM